MMYRYTLFNTILLFPGSLIAGKYFDLPVWATVTYILCGMVHLVMNQGVMYGVRSHERVVVITSIIAITVSSFLFFQLKNSWAWYPIIACLVGLGLIFSFTKKIRRQKGL